MAGLLSTLAAAGLTPQLEQILAEYALEPGAIRTVRDLIDKHGIRHPDTIRGLGDLTRANAIRPHLFPKLAGLLSLLDSQQTEAEPEPPAAAPAPRRIVRNGIDLEAKRGPGDPVLLRLGTDYPVPVEKLWPREHTQTRRLHDYLMHHRVTSAELIKLGKERGWSRAAVRKVWTLLRTQAMVRSGWLLDVGDDGRAQLIILPANYDFRRGTVLP